MKRLAAAAAIATGCLSIFPQSAGAMTLATTTADLATRTPTLARVEIARYRAALEADGSVQVLLRTRCQPWLQAFELDLGVDQAYASGAVSQLAPPAVVLCDGAWHTTLVTVLPTVGSFTAGPADVSVYLGLYDSRSGSDLEATDAETVRLSPTQ